MLRRSLFLTVSLFVLGGCATKRDVRDVQTNLQELYAQQQALVRDLQRQQRALMDTLGMLVRQEQDARAEVAMRMARIEDHVLLLQELQGVSQQQLTQLRDQVERNRPQVQVAPPPSQTNTPQASTGSAEEIFDLGVRDFNRGQFSSASYAFGEIVERFQGHPRAVDARFYLAEILEEDERLAEAIEAFRTIQQYHPTSERVPESRYRMARIYLRMGNREEMDRELDRILNTWPESDAARSAREMREDLQ